MKTVVLGASPNSDRYSYKAVHLLKKYGHEVIPVGIRNGSVEGTIILTNRPFIDNVHTVTLYVGLKNQPQYYDYVLSLHPKRIIFNPGTENMEFIKLAEKSGISTVINCTLVMLGKGIY